MFDFSGNENDIYFGTEVVFVFSLIRTPLMVSTMQKTFELAGRDRRVKLFVHPNTREIQILYPYWHERIYEQRTFYMRVTHTR